MKRLPLTRRRLLRWTAGAAPLVLPGRVLGLDGVPAPSARITLGFIGVGNHGHGYNLKSFLQESDARAVAVCDVFAGRVERARATVDAHYGDRSCRGFADFRELLAAPEVDAVCISTPDHWHVPMSLLALAAGKDVMCEKPTLTLAEGRELVREVERRRAVFQFGIEDRSVIQYHRLAEWARHAVMGPLRRIEVTLPAGPVPPREEPAPVPAGLNWRMWLGPTPFHPFTPTRTEPMVWRQIRDYSGGMLADWGAHLIDTAQVANFAEASGPVEVEGSGVIPPNSQATQPTEFSLTYRYANGVEMAVKSGGVALRLIGDKGWVGNTGWRGRLEASDPEFLKVKIDPATSRLWPLPKGEHRNFLDAIRVRGPTTYTAEAGHRLSSVMHIGTLAMELRRPLRWDPQAEEFPGDAEANARRSRPASKEWMQA
jgi:predicted dehydrogenase